MKNFNSILSILLPELVKYENVVNKIYIIVDETLKQYSNIKHNTYNSNKLLITNKLSQLQELIGTTNPSDASTHSSDIPLDTVLSAIYDIYNTNKLIGSNFEIVTLKPVLHTIKNVFSETRTVRVDKKILAATNAINNIAKCEHLFVNALIKLFIEYFIATDTYIDILLDNKSESDDELARSGDVIPPDGPNKSEPARRGDVIPPDGPNKSEPARRGDNGPARRGDGYMNQVIIGIINLYKYNPEFTERNKKITKLLYKSVYDSAGFTGISDQIDIWYDSTALNQKTGVIYKLENLVTPRTPALHTVNGISNDIVNQFNTIVITPSSEVSKYKIIRDYSNIYVKNYLREALMDTENIKFADTELLIKNYLEWKETTDIEPNILIQILARNFNKLLEQYKIGTFYDFVNLIGCVVTPVKGATVSMDYNNYIIQSFSEFYFESIARTIATQFVSSHTNALFDDQMSSDNNFMKEAYISNLVNIKSSATSLQKKIMDAANNKFKSEAYIILKYNNDRSSEAWLTLFKTIVKSIVDPGKNVKSKFVEKMNVLIPKAGLKHYIMKNPNQFSN
jgi:hypothetical protein